MPPGGGAPGVPGGTPGKKRAAVLVDCSQLSCLAFELSDCFLHQVLKHPKLFRVNK